MSFASLVLVAGMMSYLGITNKSTASKTTQDQIMTQRSRIGKIPPLTYEHPDRSMDDHGFQQSGRSFAEDRSFSRQHGNFDTTTGGT